MFNKKKNNIKFWWSMWGPAPDKKHVWFFRPNHRDDYKGSTWHAPLLPSAPNTRLGVQLVHCSLWREVLKDSGHLVGHVLIYIVISSPGASHWRSLYGDEEVHLERPPKSKVTSEDTYLHSDSVVKAFPLLINCEAKSIFPNNSNILNYNYLLL